jgi:hypothetical protein
MMHALWFYSVDCPASSGSFGIISISDCSAVSSRLKDPPFECRKSCGLSKFLVE